MAANSEEIKKFVEKRGYPCEVMMLNPKVYKISLYSARVKEVADLVASINEPGRFVVELQHDDVAELVIDTLELERRFKEVYERIDSVVTENLASISGLLMRLDKEERKKWWQKPWFRSK